MFVHLYYSSYYSFRFLAVQNVFQLCDDEVSMCESDMIDDEDTSSDKDSDISDVLSEISDVINDNWEEGVLDDFSSITYEQQYALNIIDINRLFYEHRNEIFCTENG